MKLISHRGNLKGRVPNKENRPSYVDCAIQLGYDVEVDVRYINEEFWLGHDEPDYKVSVEWLYKRKDKLWIHCKDIESSQKLRSLPNQYQYFCHNNDPYILTSTGHLWVHDLTLSLDNQCIIPLLDRDSISKNYINYVYAICSDYLIL
jgi:hypothetical protein